MGSPTISGPTAGSVQQGVGTILNGTYQETTNTITSHTWSISVQGTYGTATINSSGNLTYDLDDNHPAIKALDPGQYTTDVFRVQFEIWGMCFQGCGHDDNGLGSRH
ncbi:MAG: VCBS domain-containing protein [Cypionkella sp.]|nr:VCBS domain-containing protein [Cypionkella sp.]